MNLLGLPGATLADIKRVSRSRWPRPSAGRSSARSSPARRCCQRTPPPRRRARSPRHGDPSSRGDRHRARGGRSTASRSSPRTSRTTPRTRPASSSSPATPSPPRPATTRPRSSCSSRPTPGSLLAILQEFAARAINLTKLESRPTKRGLGDYCFLIDLEGHVDDELVADCLRDLKSKQADVKFLGSYPAAGEHGESRRRDADAAWRQADEWVRNLRGQVPPGR